MFRKISILAKEYFESSLKSYRKAAFPVACIKFLSNFEPGKITQERVIFDGLLKKSNERSSPESVHCVVSVLAKTTFSKVKKYKKIE